MNHIGTQQLTTKRLNLRRLELEDVHSMFKNWASDENVAKYTTWYAHQSEKITQEYLKMIVHSYDQLDYYCWGIEYQENLVGMISVIPVDEKAEICGIGYVLSRNYWNLGLMAEAAEAVITFLCRKVEYRRVIAWCDVANAASGIVLRKIGMQLEGKLRQHIARKDGSYGDEYIYGILKDEID